MNELTAALIGFALGFLGTLIGAGGGFLLVPILVFLEPTWSAAKVTAFSLAMVSANALSGTVSYLRAGRVDIGSFALFALAAAPGSIIGAFIVNQIPRRIFDPVFGVALIAIATWLFFRRLPAQGSGNGNMLRTLTDANGKEYIWSYDPRLGIVAGGVVGFISSLLGIGGGIIHVPLLVTAMNFPAHIATATSHAVLGTTALLATVMHIWQGDYRDDWQLVVACCAGAIAGAPLGARVSSRVPGPVILRILAVGLGFVGMRLLLLTH